MYTGANTHGTPALCAQWVHSDCLDFEPNFRNKAFGDQSLDLWPDHPGTHVNGIHERDIFPLVM